MPVLSHLVVGLFVGGRARRFGGIAKGNLLAPTGERLLERLIRVSREALPDAPITLVGAADSYPDLKLERIDDSPAGVGPLGGLRALLLHARALGKSGALALACDMPFVSAELLLELAHTRPEALLLAPRDGARWQPLAARYHRDVLETIEECLAAGEHSLQSVARRLSARAARLSLPEARARELDDWDSPIDAAADR